MISSNACERRTCDVFHRQSLFGEPCYFVAVRSVSACEESASTDFGMCIMMGFRTTPCTALPALRSLVLRGEDVVTYEVFHLTKWKSLAVA